MSSQKPSVLHLVGSTVDHGGILSVLRNVQAADADNAFVHSVWVKQGFQQVRKPELDLVFTNHDVRESIVPQIISTFREFVEARLHEKFDIIHCHGQHAHVLGWMIAISKGITVFSSIHFYAKRPWIYRSLSRLSNLKTILLTENMVAHYRMADDCFAIVPDCCDESYFEIGLSRIKSQFSCDRKLRLRGFGVLIPWKGWHILVEAVDQLNVQEQKMLDIEIVGQAAPSEKGERYANELRSQVEARNLSEVIRFSGFVTDITAKLAESDWTILPSVNEPCSVAISESLAMGIPVLVSDSGGNVDTVQDEKNGLLFRTGDSADLARKIRKILEGGTVAFDSKEIRESARIRSAKYVKDKLYELYRNEVNKKY